MAIKIEMGKGQNVLELAGTAAVDLSGSQYCMVSLTLSVTSGRFTVSLPSGQGVKTLGVLQNTPKQGEAAAVRVIGTTKVKAIGSFDADSLLTPADATGAAAEAATGEWSTMRALQAAEGAGHLVFCVVNGAVPAQLN